MWQIPYLKMLVYGSWNCIHVWYSFFLFRSFYTCCELWKCGVRTFSHKLIRKAEFKNPSSTSISQVATVWNGKQKCVRCNFLYLFIIFFLLNWDLFWNYFVTQNTMTNKLLPTHPPKTSDWRFAWQNSLPLSHKTEKFRFWKSLKHFNIFL